MEEKTKPPFFEMGQRIINAREKLTSLNQSQMQATLGLKEPTYGNYERGWRKMPPHVMDKFSNITGCLSDYIYLGKEPMTKASSLSPDIQELIDSYLQTSKAAQEAFLNMARQLPKNSE